MSYYSTPVTVVSGPAILRFRAHEEPNPEVPFDLKPFYTQDVWGPRISAVTRRASNYYKYTLELIWLIGTFAAVIAGPIVVYYVVLNNTPEPSTTDKDDHDHFRSSFDRYWKARLAGLGTFVGLMILTFVPMHMWKSAGKKAVNEMLQQYEAQDRAARPGAAVPTLRMKMPGVVTKNIKLVASIPAPPPPSLYQAGANVPPYIANPPNNTWGQGQSQGWQAPPSQGYQPPAGPPPGLVPPVYNPNDQRLPGYSNNGAPMAYSEEKAENPFEDVKV